MALAALRVRDVVGEPETARGQGLTGETEVVLAMAIGAQA
jgi:hypothetical protein